MRAIGMNEYADQLAEMLDMTEEQFLNNRDWFGYDTLVAELYSEGYTPEEAMEYITWVIEKGDDMHHHMFSDR
jgi:hypothetical protein